MIERIVEQFMDRGAFVEPEAVAYLARKPDPEGAVARILTSAQEIPFHVTLDHIRSLDPAPPTTAQPVVPTGPSPRIGHVPDALPATKVTAADTEPDVSLIKDSSRTVATAGQIKDFAHYFADRFDGLATLLRKRREVANAIPLAQAANHGKDVQLIGIIQDISTTPNGHVFLELEDDTDTVSVLVPKSEAALIGEAQSLLLDEVIGLVANPSKDGTLLVANQLVRPDIPFRHQPTERDIPYAVGFLSDIHVGSNTFLPKPFQKMIRWLNGKTGTENERALARRIKYLVLSGDVVDGIGIYPGQDEELDLDTVHDQYHALGQLLAQAPDDVHFIIQPGNHDAVRPTEPQPSFGKDIKEHFDGIDATFVSNPSTFALHGVEMLSYHGFSMIDFATRVPGLKMDDPMPIMQQMLRSRHIAPTYGGGTPLSPEERDFLVLDRVPDVFVTGHVHVTGRSSYRGVAMVNSGTWQDQTKYQKVHNIIPTPARMPVMNLSDLRSTEVTFSV